MRRHLKRTIAACAAVTLLAPSAQADFTLRTATQANPKSVPAAQRTGQDLALPAAGPPKSRFKLAVGFGRDVPLSFAARQIVPRSVAIQFAPAVDPDSLVSWAGGRPWNQVLAAAVTPLGLHVATGTTSVRISR